MISKRFQSVVLALSCLLLCGFESERKNLETYTQNFLTVLEANPACDELARQIDAWMKDNASALSSTQQNLENAIGTLQPDQMEPSKAALDDLANTFLSSPAHARVLACQLNNPAIERNYESFLQATFVPTHTALEARVKALEKIDAERKANMELAEVSVEILEHYLPHLDILVRAYETDCKRLSEAVDAWSSKNHDLLENASKHLREEVSRMSTWELKPLKGRIAKLTLDPKTNATIDRCTQELKTAQNEQSHQLLKFSKQLRLDEYFKDIKAAQDKAAQP